MKIKDSGERSEFSTGAHRDCAEGKGRMDLLPFRALIALAKVYEEGAEKYDDNNWRKGIPLSRYVDSAGRHLAKWMIGWRDEPHLAQCAWNIMSLIETIGLIEESLLPAELNDLPYCELQIKDNPNSVPPLKTASSKPDMDTVKKAEEDIEAGRTEPIEAVILKFGSQKTVAETAIDILYRQSALILAGLPNYAFGILEQPAVIPPDMSDLDMSRLWEHGL